jgi:hypothetical protein
MAGDAGPDGGGGILAEVPDAVALAREYAVLGAYDTALAYYERAVGAFARYSRTLVDTAERAKWAKVREATAPFGLPPSVFFPPRVSHLRAPLPPVPRTHICAGQG